MTTAQVDGLTQRHLAVFGAILQGFARYELAIEQAIAGLLRTDASSIAILMRQVSFMDKRMALLDLLRERSIPGDKWERIFAHLAVPARHVGLRNQIAHSTWAASPEPNSIQPDWILQWPPSIEPTLQTPRSEDNQYTFEMLDEIASNLAARHQQFLAYLNDVGLMPSAG